MPPSEFFCAGSSPVDGEFWDTVIVLPVICEERWQSTVTDGVLQLSESPGIVDLDAFHEEALRSPMRLCRLRAECIRPRLSNRYEGNPSRPFQWAAGEPRQPMLQEPAITTTDSGSCDEGCSKAHWRSGRVAPFTALSAWEVWFSAIRSHSTSAHGHLEAHWTNPLT